MRSHCSIPLYSLKDIQSMSYAQLNEEIQSRSTPLSSSAERQGESSISSLPSYPEPAVIREAEAASIAIAGASC
jgi:hypothetical protein